MPIYEYECEQCGVRFERFQRMADESLTACPECSGGHVHRVMQPVGVIFKGAGFYVTDNRGKSSTAIPTATKKDGEGGGASDSTEKKTAEPAKESKSKKEEKPSSD